GLFRSVDGPIVFIRHGNFRSTDSGSSIANVAPFAHCHCFRLAGELQKNGNVVPQPGKGTIPMANRDIVAIGASAGGVEALTFLASNFPQNFPTSILVTIHIPAEGGSVLDEILRRAGPLPAVFSHGNDRLKKGHIYIAPTDRHLIVDDDKLLLGYGSRENNSRPAIDPMLRSTAVCCGPRTIGVVLTGTMDDGASGLWAVEQCGGITVVQDPSDAEFSEMPRNAISLVQPDHIVALHAIPQLLNSLTLLPIGAPVPF